MTRVHLTGDWRVVMPFLRQLNYVTPGVVQKAVMQEALLYEREMKQRITTQAVIPPPLAPLTLALRKFKGFDGTKALTRTGGLWRSIKAQEVERQGRGFKILVGVNRKARSRYHGGKQGAQLINVAMAQEFGTKPFFIRVTPRLRKFWLAMWYRGIVATPLKSSTTVLGPIQLPARPFVGPVFEANKAQSPKRIQDRAFRELRALVTRFGGRSR